MNIHLSKAANKAKFTSLRTVVNNFVVSLNVFILLDLDLELNHCTKQQTWKCNLNQSADWDWLESYHLLVLNTVWAQLQQHRNPAIPVIKKKEAVNYILKCCHDGNTFFSSFFIQRSCHYYTIYVQHLVSICIVWRRWWLQFLSAKLFPAFVSLWFLFSPVQQDKVCVLVWAYEQYCTAWFLCWHPPQRKRSHSREEGNCG